MISLLLQFGMEKRLVLVLIVDNIRFSVLLLFQVRVVDIIRYLVI